MKHQLLVILLCSTLFSVAESPVDSLRKTSKVILVPFPSMMYFSDADPDLARYSKVEERKVIGEMRNNMEANAYHQLLSAFDVVSLMRAGSLNGEEDLKNIYGATKYGLYSKQQKEAYQKEKGLKDNAGVKALLGRFGSKNDPFTVSDSMVMLGAIDNKDVFRDLHEKYREDYILYLTQFEVSTSNKNSIEWLKQDYKRQYVLHYNLFDKSGALIRAEILTLNAGNENNMKDISGKYMIVLAQRLKEIIAATDNK